MPDDPIPHLEYENMVFGRHQALFTGRTTQEGGPLDQSAYVLLSLLRASGPASISELSAVTGLDASTLNRQTAALLRKGYAERIPDPEGGIARKFRNSTVGDEVLDEVRAATREKLAEILEDWSAGELATFTDLLGKMNRAIEKRTGRPWPRP
ncbi:MarR family winged helix-turn-helix transcriptional regulator [Corynebacterium halotolerans]|uniref:HTH marR-type domain-containing protein n=1 Tax=Corynebacterium halotolerans YIM 70093 = DSM 44683 TaxID=1121362 RepID=M1P4W6_9CORY|nr:MarR family winged helix-turn-helix transcriptional regulator [Corynebacterium halotolerans]AGF71706.1 hypothetical protein A605_03475 [Corynebacterium halotolerans YIM 70093 = DSM 44683]